MFDKAMIGIQLPYMFKKKSFTSPSLDCAYNVNKDLTLISCYKKIKIEWMFTKCKIPDNFAKRQLCNI